MAKPRYLTKSKFITALDCPRKLYYYGKSEYANLNDTNDFLQALAEGGYQVGELAKEYYPGGHDIETLNIDEAIKETNELLKKDNVIIYEAAVQFKSCFIRVDILKKTGNSIELIEVKAKSFNSEEDSFLNKKGFIESKWVPYLYDVAFQLWVMQNALPDWNITPYLFVADKSASASVDGLNQLFKMSKDSRGRKKIVKKENITKEDLGDQIMVCLNAEECTDLIFTGKDLPEKKKEDESGRGFEERINEYSKYYCDDIPYKAKISSKCKKCEYKNDKSPELKSGFKECWKEACGNKINFNEPHIFDLWNFKQSDELIESNIYHLKDIPHCYFTPDDGEPLPHTKERQYLQIEKTCGTDKSEYVAPKLLSEMKTWKYPLHFIDFETSMAAIPFNKGRHPYEQTAFQFSCHSLYKDGSVIHDEYISNEPGKFPNFEFVNELKKVLQNDEGSIFRFAAHENTVLRQIQTQMYNSITTNEQTKFDLRELIDWIETVVQYEIIKKTMHYGKRNMIDMCQLVRDYYYHPRMGGSNSIKQVLPAIMCAGKLIKEKYSKPLPFGTHLKNMILWKINNDNTEPLSPYKLLPPIFEDIDIDEEEIELFFDVKGISEGGAAATAYAKMQFEEMSDIERSRITESLLRYCELDTLAMVMIYEHWKSIK